MQTQGGADAAAAVTSPERRFTARLRVDWNRNGAYNHAMTDMSAYVQSANTDASLKGSLPTELSTVEGSSSAQLTVTLSGQRNGLGLDAIFSPYRSGSPINPLNTIGVEIKYDLGMKTAIGTIWYPQFVGNIRQISPDRGSGEVEITALDRVEQLRRPITLPTWAIFEYHAGLGVVESQYADGQWVIDHALKLSDASASPYRPATQAENGITPDDRRTQTQVWISGAGSWVPNVGLVDNWNTQDFPRTPLNNVQMYDQVGLPNPDSPLPTNYPQAFNTMDDTLGYSNYYWGADRDYVNSLGAQFLGFTLITNGRNADYYKTAPDYVAAEVNIGDGYGIRIWIGNGQVWSDFSKPTVGLLQTTAKVNIPTGQRGVRVNVAWEAFSGAGVKGWVKAGANETGSDYTVLAAPISWGALVDPYQGFFHIIRRQGLQDIYWVSTNFGGTSAPTQTAQWGNRAGKYAATVDKGLVKHSFFPQVRSQDAWDLISNVAEAEFGSAFWDENGKFNFWNMERMQMLRNNPVRNFYLDDLTSLGFTNSLDSVRNVISVDGTARVAYGDASFVADGVDQFILQPGETRTFVFDSQDTQTPSPEKVVRYTTDPAMPFGTPLWYDQVDHGYVAQYFDGGVWQEQDFRVSGVDVFASFDPQNRLVLVMRNGYDVPSRFASNAGSPALHVGGTVTGSRPPTATMTANTTSSAKYGSRSLVISGNWVSDAYNHNGMVERLLGETVEPVPVADTITIPGDPRLQRGDTIEIRDRSGLGERFAAQIYGINRTFNIETGLVDVLTVQLTRLTGGLWDDTQYGLWDVNLVWGY